MNKQSTLEEWMEYAQTVHFRSIDMSLERVRKVFQRLGPVLTNTVVVIVGGTNGKGSSVSMLESIYDQAGYSTASFTSPHLVEFNERFRYNLTNLSDPELVASFEKINALREDVVLTYFEFATLVAIDCLLQKQPDVLIMETGMGGRLDSVNILNPDCVLLTHVALDHTQWLGDSREKIGLEKAGLFRSGVPAICADYTPPLTVLEYARKVNASLKLINRDFKFSTHTGSWDWKNFGETTTRLKNLPFPAITGAGQIKNASGVLMAIHSLGDVLPVGKSAIECGLRKAVLSGRLQKVEFNNREIILDVAHNADAVGVLGKFLESHPAKGRTLAVLGMLGDKNVQQALCTVIPMMDFWHLATLDEPRGAKSGFLEAQLLQVNESVQYNCHTTPVAAFKTALLESTNRDRIVVFGSFHTVGAILSFLKQKN